MAAVGAEGAGALEGADCEVGVDFSNLAGGGGFCSGERIGCGHGLGILAAEHFSEKTASFFKRGVVDEIGDGGAAERVGAGAGDEA